MDNLDSLSDCSESSRNSGCLSTSNISNFSGLSEYQSEFLQLKQLVNIQNNLGVFEKQHESVEKRPTILWYENRIQSLKVHAEKLSSENNKLKNDLFKIENEGKLTSSSKIEQLLLINRNLEANLKAANKQIQRLIDVHNIQDGPAEGKIGTGKVLTLEKCINNLTIQNVQLSNKLHETTCEKNRVEGECSNLQTEYNELKLEFGAKENCVIELKGIISEQHIKLQNALQNTIKQTQTIETKTSDIEYLKKVENWYKEELQKIQQEKNSLSDEIVEIKKDLVSHVGIIERLKLELNQWKCKYDEFQLLTLKEKETLLKKMEIISDVGSKEETLRLVINDPLDIERIAISYQAIINDLTTDIGKIKTESELQHELLSKVSKEKSDLLAKHLFLQSCLNEKDNIIENLEESKKNLKIKLQSTIDNEQEFRAKLISLEKINTKLEIERNMVNEEKKIVENTVKSFRDQFASFKINYNALNIELKKKNKQILQLQLEKEKLYKDINWKTCALETKKNTEDEISVLNNKVSLLTKSIEEQQLEIFSHLRNIESLKKDKLEFHGKMNEFKLHYANITEKMISRSQNDLNKLLSIFNVQDSLFLNDNVESSDKKQNTISGNNNYGDSSFALMSSLATCPTDCEDFLVFDYQNIAHLLHYICEFLKVNECGENMSTQEFNILSNDNKIEYIKSLLQKVLTTLRIIISGNNSKTDQITVLEKQLTSLKRKLFHEVDKLRNKCKILENKCEETANLLDIFNQKNIQNGDQQETIKHLQTLLTVKIREQSEQQKRFQRNYGTLLRKVKEHMKGRNVSEKRNTYLQDMHSRLSDQCNTLRLELNMKNLELNSLQNVVETHNHNNEKLKTTILKLDQELDMRKSKGQELEISHMEELNLKKELIDALQAEIGELKCEVLKFKTSHGDHIVKMKCISENNRQLLDSKIALDNALREERALTSSLKIRLAAEEQTILKLRNEFDNLTKTIENLSEKNQYYIKEMEYTKSWAQRKSNELEDLRNRKDCFEEKQQENNYNLQTLITSLKSQLQQYINDLGATKSEKFFLQRLCNDLKVALEIHVHHNKLLKDYINSILKERDLSNNLPFCISKFPSPIKYDDTYINKLLAESKAPLEDKPLSDIEDCLFGLKNEISILQKQISEKNCFY